MRLLALEYEWRDVLAADCATALEFRRLPPVATNTDSLIDYGQRYRSKLPISTSRAEGCADEIANARMAKKQRMRWSPQGAYRMSTVCAAVLDGRLKAQVGLPLAASQTSFFPLPLGAGIVGPSAGDLIAEAVVAIEIEADDVDVGMTIHPHPTFSGTVGLAAEAFAGTITDILSIKGKR